MKRYVSGQAPAQLSMLLWIAAFPFRRLTDGSMVQFGWGSRQRRIQAAETDFTGAVAESIAQDKELTRFLLSAAGIPVAPGRPVADARMRGQQRARSAVQSSSSLRTAIRERGSA